MPLRSNSLRRARPLLGTLVEITASGASAGLPTALDAAFAAIEQIDRLMSFHAPNSDVSRINAAIAGCEIRVHPHTSSVLHFARKLSALSDGAFDITIADVLMRNGFLPRPEESAVARTAAAATFDDLVLLPDHRVRWRRKGWIDLGGIAKGYAVDCAIGALRAHGLASAVVNAGGDLRFFGDPQPIHARHPDAPTSLVPLGVFSDCAVATSSGYFSGRISGSGVTEPLVDPTRRACVRWGQSVTVVAPDGMTADALTKIVRLSAQAAPSILERLRAQAMVIDSRGMRRCGITTPAEATAA
ncbi:thiamine biosynthesis protein ApbE [Variovorax sp. Root318D1]|uniref:FAD:protein FMN transferase n=1 Tax=Variovorax sp. Root318D1 TaxID=1736513 RepID=UPI0006F7C7EE|nr:FAD:protein FMN transferase [Variovorax sp. Root318D1]KQU89770.1 thiamine biosynthesis protein ApbE [Variovorax sp. Root318D1]